MSEKDLLELAKQHVPEHVRPTGRVLSEPEAQRVLAAKKTVRGTPEPSRSLAELVLEKHRKGKPKAAAAAKESESADVVFTDSSSLGSRATVVRIRGGKVKSVLKLG